MKRWLWRVVGGLAAVAIVATVAGVFVVRSQWFFDYVKTRIVDEARRATGARVEMEKFSFDWTAMQARVDGFTLHGKESAEEAPLAQGDLDSGEERGPAVVGCAEAAGEHHHLPGRHEQFSGTGQGNAAAVVG
jgi:hypothetical protein